MTTPQPCVPSPSPIPTMSDKTFTILQWNANGIGNKQTELSIFLEVKVAAIQESNLTAQSRSPTIQNYTLVRQDRCLGPEGGLLAILSKIQSASLAASHCQQRQRMTPPRRTDHQRRYGYYRVAHYQLVYLPASCCNGCYSPPLDHMLTCTDSLVLGDFNAHHSLWHSGTIDPRCKKLGIQSAFPTLQS